jgi:putative flippase GtrA
MTQQETHAGRGPTALVRRALGRHEVRYLLVAGTTTLFYLALVGAGLLAGLPYMLAIACAHAVTICAAFPAYRHLVFRSRRAWPADLWRFLSVWSGGIIVVAVSSYLAHRFWSFGHREPDDAPAHAAGTGGGPG